MGQGVCTERLKDESGSSAVEFAMIAPVFLFMLLGMIAYGIYFGAAHAVQQIAANAARSAVAGLDLTEQRELALASAQASATNNGLILIDNLEIHVTPETSRPDLVRVTVTYDANQLPIWDLGPPIPLPDKTIRRVSVIPAGGL